MCQHVNSGLDAGDEEGANPATENLTEDNESDDHSSKRHLGVPGADKQDAQKSEEIEMTEVKVRTRHKVCGRRRYNLPLQVSCTFLRDWLTCAADKIKPRVRLRLRRRLVIR